MPVPDLSGDLGTATSQLRGGARVMCCRTWRRLLGSSNPARALAQLARTQLGASSEQVAGLLQLTAPQVRLMARGMTMTVCPKDPSPFGAGLVKIPTLDPYIQVTLDADRGVTVRAALPRARSARRTR